LLLELQICAAGERCYLVTANLLSSWYHSSAWDRVVHKLLVVCLVSNLLTLTELLKD